MRRIVTVSLSSLDLFICCLLSFCLLPLPLPVPSVPMTVNMVIPSLTSWLSFVSVLSSFSHCCLSCPLPQTQTVFYDFSVSSSGCLIPPPPPPSHPPWTPLSQQSCQIKITSLKIQSTLPLQTARASLLAIHVFRCTLYHGGDALEARGVQHGNSIKIWCIHS